MKYLIIALAMVLIGCQKPERTPQQKQADNQNALQQPQVIGVLPDGRLLYHATVSIQNSSYAQQVYWAGHDITVNTRGSSGKTSRPLVSTVVGAPVPPTDIVVINGQRYDPKEIDQLIQREEDRARLSR